ncbi:MAG: glycosyltransferase family 4 protein [Rhodospirillales bacterium]|nr:glycosyltransferase family 4 protein [Rhodospirillales bacterium]
MRILYSHRIQSRDGQSVHVEALIAALRAQGHEVQVVGPGFYERADFGGESRLVAAIRARLPAMLGEIAEILYNIPATRRLDAACRAFRPDAIYERYNLYYLAGLRVARRHRLPLLLEVNAPIAAERARFGALALRRIARLLENRVWRGAARVLAVTEVLKQDIVATAGLDPARVAVIHNGIHPEAFADLARDPGREGRIVLGFVGFVRGWHGLDTVIAQMGSGSSGSGASEHDTALSLVVVGDGPARPALEAQAAAAGLAGRVRFTGLAPRAQIPALVAGFDIALQPSAVAYASPLKIFEYMAAGCAIVAPDQPNIREILADGETALLFAPGDAAAMWQAVRRLAGDAALRTRLGDAAKAEIAARDFTWEGNARRVAALAEQLRPARSGAAD